MDVKGYESVLGRELSAVERERVAQAGGNAPASPLPPEHEEKIWFDPQELFLTTVFETIPGVEDELLEILRAPPGDARDAARQAWQEQWNLTADWCLKKTIYDAGAPSDDPFAPAPAFTFSCAGWDPRGQRSQTREIARIRAAFEEALAAHVTATEEHLHSLGWINTGEKEALRHFEWAARVQCGKESAGAVAKSVGVKRSSVGQPVNEILDDLGLSARTTAPETRLRPGRKSGKRNRQVET